MNKGFIFIWMIVLAIMTLSCRKGSITGSGTGGGTNPPPVDTTSVYLKKANQTYAFIKKNLLTPYKCYRVNTTTNTNSAFEWYNASQIYADAAMIANGDSSYVGPMNGTFDWMNNLWDKADTYGGYFAFANLDGSGASGTKYVDDNSLTGVVYLAAYDVTTGTDKQNYLSAAEKCANWLINSGLWDNNFGGGFWWNTNKTVKSTQTNGLALQLFLRLYQITGKSVYHDWAISVDTWLNNKMYDSSNGLYIWQIEKDGTRDSTQFTYDNAIMVEADLLYSKVMNKASYLPKAQALGNAMIATLWDNQHSVFIFNTADKRINPTYCGWASEAMIKLYQADDNKMWLTYAKGNIDAINVVLRDPGSYGYYQYAGLDGNGRYSNMEEVDQAWMQRVQVLLSKYK